MNANANGAVAASAFLPTNINIVYAMCGACAMAGPEHLLDNEKRIP